MNVLHTPFSTSLCQNMRSSGTHSRERSRPISVKSKSLLLRIRERLMISRDGGTMSFQRARAFPEIGDGSMPTGDHKHTSVASISSTCMSIFTYLSLKNLPLLSISYMTISLPNFLTEAGGRKSDSTFHFVNMFCHLARVLAVPRNLRRSYL